jgi:hypothetical protein
LKALQDFARAVGDTFNVPDGAAGFSYRGRLHGFRAHHETVVRFVAVLTTIQTLYLFLP